MPKYKQIGDLEMIRKDEFYLVIFIQKADVFGSLEDRGDVGVFVTAEWGGT